MPAQSTKSNCPICGSNSPNTVLRAIDSYPLSKCSTCEGLSVTPLPTFEQLRAAYQGFNAGELSRLYFEEYKVLSIKILRNELQRSFGNLAWDKLNMLDYGCGGGHFMAAAAELGLDSFGMELDGESVESLKKRGFQTLQGQLPEDMTQLSGRNFDIIKCMHVIEHVPSPVDLLQSFEKLLRPNGVILLGLPDQTSFPSQLKIAMRALGLKRTEYGYVQPPIHLHGFTKGTIEIAAKKCGLSVGWIDKVSPLDRAQFPSTREYWQSLPAQRLVYRLAQALGSPGYFSVCLKKNA